MIRNRLLKVFGVVIVLIIIIVIVLRVVDINGRPERVAFMLNITSTPKSMRVIDCDSLLIPTDEVIICTIEIDPLEFPHLLKGYEFTKSAINGTSHTQISEKVGPEFSVAFQFSATPKDFIHGGQVSVFTDTEMKRALIEYYKE
jgi:hypothetical protein